jgi:hypothetical protein
MIRRAQGKQPAMRLLISLCNANQYNSQFALAVVDSETGESWLVDCSAFLDFKMEAGVTGLLPTGDGLVVAVQSNRPRIVRFDRDFNVTWSVTDDRLADVHGLSLHPDGRILVTSTGRNKILEIDPATGEIGVFWEYVLDTPFLHINSLAFHDGRAVVCSHKLPGEAKHPYESGGCWRLDDFGVVIPGLLSPHTLTARDGGLTCLSSSNGKVAHWRDGAVTQTEVTGYLRGMLETPDAIFLGSSALRFVSRKAHGVKRYADFDKVIRNPAYMSSLVVCDAGFQEVRRIPTTFLGFEIYDVIADPGVPAAWLTSPAPAIRMQTMQRLTLTLRDQLQAALNRAKRKVRDGAEA